MGGVCEFPAMLVSGSGLEHSLIRWEKRVCDFGWHHTALRSSCCCSRGPWRSDVQNSAATCPWLWLSVPCEPVMAFWVLLFWVPELSGARSKRGL